ncbi:MAG: phosphoribosylglycinamide formyltransferase [Candidatus Undinarchaeales archaeon]
MKNLNLAVLASTSGTDLQAIIDEIDSGKLENVNLKCVIANKDCGALKKARKAGIEDILIESEGKEREEFDKLVAEDLEKRDVELIVLIGYMRYLSKWFVNKYENQIMNVHPSLLPAFAGGMDLNVHEEILKHGVKVTGCTIHFVDEGKDTGPIIIQRCIPVDEDETEETLKEKVQALEKEAYPEAIRLYRDGKLKVEGRKVKILD